MYFKLRITVRGCKWREPTVIPILKVQPTDIKVAIAASCGSMATAMVFFHQLPPGKGMWLLRAALAFFAKVLDVQDLMEHSSTDPTHLLLWFFPLSHLPLSSSASKSLSTAWCLLVSSGHSLADADSAQGVRHVPYSTFAISSSGDMIILPVLKS